MLSLVALRSGVLDGTLIRGSHGPLVASVARVQVLVLLEPELRHLRPAGLVRLFEELIRPLVDVRLYFAVLILACLLVDVGVVGPQIVHDLDFLQFECITLLYLALQNLVWLVSFQLLSQHFFSLKPVSSGLGQSLWVVLLHLALVGLI